MDEPNPPQPIPNPKISTICEECSSNPWKYRCPGCSLRSCSLPCVNAHKKRTGCTGKRQLTEVSIAEFDDNLIISDYKMLEEANRLAESSRRVRQAICGYYRRDVPPRLCLAARVRRFRIQFMSAGMSRRVSNKTEVSKKNNVIFWTIEWRFHSTDVVLIDHDVNENTMLSTIIQKHLVPGPWNNQLKPFCNTQLDDLNFFIKTKQRSPKSPYRRLNINAPIRQQLRSTVVFEYPVIHVFLPSDSFDFKIEKWEFRVRDRIPSPSRSTRSPCPRGPIVREEEVEEGEVSPTRILDLKMHASSAAEDAWAAEKTGDPDDKVFIPCDDGEDAKDESPAFDYEKELSDFYTDCFGEINPDDFLCLNGVLDESCVGMEDKEKSLYLLEKFLLEEEEEEEVEVEEELEEGEIPN